MRSYLGSFVVMVLGLLSLFPGCSGSGDTPEVLVQRGNLLRDDGRDDEARAVYRDAIEGFQEYLTDQPENGYIWFEMANVYSELGEFEAAADGYTKAMGFSTEYAESAEAWYRLATAHFNLGNKDEALEAYDMAIRYDPQDAIAFNDRGWLMQTEFGNVEAALHDYTEAVRLNPGDQIAVMNRAMLRKETGELELALADMNRAVEIVPEHPGNYFERAEIRMLLGEHAAAIEDYSQAIQLDPEFSDAYLGRGVARRELGMTAEAQADFDKALELSPALTIPPAGGVAAAPAGLDLSDAFVMDHLEEQGYADLSGAGEGPLRIKGARDGQRVAIFVATRHSEGEIRIMESDVAAIRDSAEPVDLVIVERRDAASPLEVVKIVRDWSPTEVDLRPVQFEVSIP